MLITGALVIVSTLLYLTNGADVKQVPANFVIADDVAWVRKSLTVYGNDCEEVLRIRRNCKSWNNDVFVYQIDSDGDRINTVVTSTNFKTKGEDSISVFVGEDQDKPVLMVEFEQRISYAYAHATPMNMRLYDPNAPKPENANEEDYKDGYGKLVAKMEGTTVLTDEFYFTDYPSGTSLYNVSDNAFNFDLNECRSQDWFANKFYTVSSNPNYQNANLSSSFITKEMWVAFMSTLILTSDGSDLLDACSSWHLYARWVLLAVCLATAVGLSIYFGYKGYKKGWFKRFYLKRRPAYTYKADPDRFKEFNVSDPDRIEIGRPEPTRVEINTDETEMKPMAATSGPQADT